MEEFALVHFLRKSGKVKLTLTGKGTGMLKLWALQNVTKTTDAIIFNLETGEVVAYYEGTGNFPKVIKGTGEHINEYCYGLLEILQEGRENP